MAGDGLDAAHAGGHAGFRHHLEQADVAGARHMGAAAQLAAAANIEHPHVVAVFLAKQHHRAGLLGRLDVHHPRLRRRVGQDFGVNAGFDVPDFRVAERPVVGIVKACAFRIHQAAFLHHMRTQHLAQRLVHQMGDAVVAHGRRAPRHVDLRCHRVTYRQATLQQRAVVTKHIGLDLHGVLNVETRRLGRLARDHQTGIAHLTTAFRIKRCGGQHQHAVLTFF